MAAAQACADLQVAMDAINDLQGQMAQAKQVNVWLEAAATAQAQINANFQAQENIAPVILPMQFYLSPAALGAGTILDYGMSTGEKIHKAAIKALPMEYNLDQDNLKVFLETLETRARNNGWIESIMTVSQNGEQYYILTSYGTLTWASILAHMHTYALLQVYDVQDSGNLYILPQEFLNWSGLEGTLI